MFELPDAKRVRREDLESSSEDESPGREDQQDAELLATLHARMAGMLDLSSLDQPSYPTAPTTAKEDDSRSQECKDGDAGDDGPEEFEFRLFSTTNPATKIALIDEDERALEGDGDMVRKRPVSYYIAGEPTLEARAEFASAAVSGEDVLQRAGQRWWGMQMPWRVTRTTATSTTNMKTGDETGHDGKDRGAAAKRRRPGKKKRIALRMKEREEKKKAEEKEKATMTKEEHLKEKKKRLNRLKKLRRRAKDKETKLEQGDEGTGGDNSASDDEL